ncbi:RsmB/NOP family class I SAM-dependent RNA methyltransferase [bacterium]|nr:RsmB/NOP family class I SAM-dependent RNA methyltransferase [bacterium]
MRFNQFLGNILAAALEKESCGDKYDILLNEIFKAKRLGKRDRIWVADRFFFYLRHKLFFDEVSENTESLAKNIAMVFENEPDEILAQKIENLKKRGVFEKLFNESFPEFLSNKIRSLYGSDAFLWFNSKAKTVLRTNLRKISREELSEMLRSEGFENSPAPLSPAGIILEPTNKSLKNIELFENGFFEFQDESSQLASLLVNKNSKTLLEPCAGGGGKSLSISSFFSGIKVTASDSRTHLFKEIKERADRAGTKIEASAFSDISGDFDTVFIDSPCSGSGVLRRNPGDRWNISEKMLSDLNKLQSELIRKFAAKVKKGGELIYITCSFLECENEKIVQDFLNENRGFSLISAETRLSENIKNPASFSEITNGLFFRTKPFSERDLMFGAVMKRDS